MQTNLTVSLVALPSNPEAGFYQAGGRPGTAQHTRPLVLLQCRPCHVHDQHASDFLNGAIHEQLGGTDHNAPG